MGSGSSSGISRAGAGAAAAPARVGDSKGAASAAVATVARSERRDSALPGMSGWDMFSSVTVALQG